MADKDGIVGGVKKAYQDVKGVVGAYKQMYDESKGVADKAKNVGEYSDATTEKPATVKTVSDKPINPNAKYGDKPGEKRIDVKNFAKGIDTVPAMLTPGERVLKASDNKKLKGMSNMRLVEAALAHKKQEAQEPAAEEKNETPAKELKELRIRPTADKKHAIIEHHYTHPEAHQMEEHASMNKKHLAQHIMQHMDGMDEGEDSEGAQSLAEGTESVKPSTLPDKAHEAVNKYVVKPIGKLADAIFQPGQDLFSKKTMPTLYGEGLSTRPSKPPEKE